MDPDLALPWEEVCHVHSQANCIRTAETRAASAGGQGLRMNMGFELERPQLTRSRLRHVEALVGCTAARHVRPAVTGAGRVDGGMHGAQAHISRGVDGRGALSGRRRIWTRGVRGLWLMSMGVGCIRAGVRWAVPAEWREARAQARSCPQPVEMQRPHMCSATRADWLHLACRSRRPGRKTRCCASPAAIRSTQNVKLHRAFPWARPLDKLPPKKIPSPPSLPPLGGLRTPACLPTHKCHLNSRPLLLTSRLDNLLLPPIDTPLCSRQRKLPRIFSQPASTPLPQPITFDYPKRDTFAASPSAQPPGPVSTASLALIRPR